MSVAEPTNASTESPRTDTTTSQITTRPGAASVFLTQWWVPTKTSAVAELDRLADIWDAVALPSWVRTLRFYKSVDETTCLMYAECEPEHTLAPLVQQLPAGYSGRRLSEFIHEGTVLVDPTPSGAHQSAPGPVVVVASFDVDGPERQRAVVDSVVQRISESSVSDQEGLISADLYTSVDGTRVLNFATWTTDDAHERFLMSRSRHTNLKVTTEIPGVRPIGFVRYHLVRSRTTA